jgi:hypothetical protein
VSGLAAIVIDCERAAPLARFWSLALGWPIRPYDQAEIERLAAEGRTPETDPTVAIDSPDGTLSVFCVEVPERKAERETWVVMADPEGNEFCVVDPPSA